MSLIRRYHEANLPENSNMTNSILTPVLIDHKSVPQNHLIYY